MQLWHGFVAIGGTSLGGGIISEGGKMIAKPSQKDEKHSIEKRATQDNKCVCLCVKLTMTFISLDKRVCALRGCEHEDVWAIHVCPGKAFHVKHTKLDLRDSRCDAVTPTCEHYPRGSTLSASTLQTAANRHSLTST